MYVKNFTKKEERFSKTAVSKTSDNTGLCWFIKEIWKHTEG